MRAGLGTTAELATLLDGINGGEAGAFAQLVEAVYDDLKRLAAGSMADQFNRPLASLTISPTAVVNDAVMELRRQRQAWQNSDHFFAVATLLIRRLVLMYQRQRLAQKRGGGRRGASIDESKFSDVAAPEEREVNDDALSALERLHEQYPRKAEVVSLHVLCGHPLPKVADMIGVSLPTVERDWRFARAWLKDALGSTAVE
jgi:RNA polymerase sigma factor (TIGR02999 family)